MKVEINFFQSLVNVDILTSFHESRMFLMASRIVNIKMQDLYGVSVYPSTKRYGNVVVTVELVNLNDYKLNDCHEQTNHT